MPKYAQLVISLPLLALSLVSLSLKPAVAETVGIERALELLAKTTVVDAKCHILNASERDELSNYISRAEVSAAQKTTVEITRSSLATGTRAGKATACDQQASSDVRDTLMAARAAIKSVTQKEQMAAVKPPIKLVGPEKLATVLTAEAVRGRPVPWRRHRPREVSFRHMSASLKLIFWNVVAPTSPSVK